MQYRKKTSDLIGFFSIAILLGITSCEKKISYPVTEVKTVTDTLHGTVIEDPYRWLEDQNSPETRAWIEAQTALLDSLKREFPGMDKIRRRLLELIKVDVTGIPTEAGGKYFYSARSKDEELYSIYVREGLEGPEKKLVDPRQVDENLTRSVEIQAVSDNGDFLAYNVREAGQDEVIVKIMNVNSGHYLDDIFPKAYYTSLDFTRDNKGCYYGRMEKEGSRIYFHRFGTPFTGDRLIFGEGYDAQKYISASLSEDKKYLMIVVYHGAGGLKTEVWLKDVSKDGPVKPIVTDIEAQFSPVIVDNKMYFLTDWKAPNKRVLAADLAKPAVENWLEIIPEKEFPIENLSPAGGKLFVEYLENVTGHIRIFSPQGELTGEVALPALGSVSGMYGRWAGKEAFYKFSTYTIPETIFRFDVSSGKSFVWSEKKVPFASNDYEVKQVWFTSQDSTRVPMFLVYKKGLKLDGHNPTLLTGYGGFSASMTPYFSVRYAMWLEMGGMLAEVNLRGGSEFGEAWHRAGMLESKQNTFDDFIAAAEWLIDNKYTRASRLALFGGSNGGLLMGAVLTQRPELFKAIVCTYPLLDMLRYHKFLLGPLWVSEYGSADNAEQFEYIYKYSPYHHVKKGVSYPAVLFITGDGDTRVDPMHARKMTAMLQARTGSGNPILLHYETAIGHSGGLAVSKGIEQEIDMQSFLSWQLGLEL
ncbi:MAG: prolyl oligopeptidase family serine peptidase [candidate division Zixibacteria bacterium]|nr:prolyl oligopeptidase family serine peptidase [candidate division Zixibacteria bacterium]MDD5426292.1 prolyl oligopeptidase family serine peptidase [candidate division Zixibacteria bacterium]